VGLEVGADRRADPRHVFLFRAGEGHVSGRIEQQVRAVALAAQAPHGIALLRVDGLVARVEPRAGQVARQELGDRALLAGRAGNADQVQAQPGDALGIDLRRRPLDPLALLGRQGRWRDGDVGGGGHQGLLRQDLGAGVVPRRIEVAPIVGGACVSVKAAVAACGAGGGVARCSAKAQNPESGVNYFT
jgi:hypothetical protein